MPNRFGFAPHLTRRRTNAVRPARRARFAVAAALALLLGSSCRVGTAPPETATTSNQILVSAAISLKDAFTELATRFEASGGVKVIFNFGGSGELEKQIEFGAPADVFASADEQEMDELAAKGLIDAESRADFAQNTLVLIVPAAAGSPGLSFSDLIRPNFKRIAIGNPRTVPAGHYAEQALENSHLWQMIQGRLVLAENVRQVLEYVAQGEADAGLVYSTDIEVARGRVRVVADAPKCSYGPVRYPIAKVKGSQHSEAAGKFLAFVLSAEGQNILRKHGFTPVN